MKQRIEQIIEKRAKEIIATRRKIYIVEYIKEIILGLEGI